MKKIDYDGSKNIIGSRLETLRREKGLSQAQLAARMQTMNVNIDQQMISRIERSLRIVTDYELVCFSRVLGVEEKSLLEDFYKKLEEKGQQSMMKRIQKKTGGVARRLFWFLYGMGKRGYHFLSKTPSSANRYRI